MDVAQHLRTLDDLAAILGLPPEHLREVSSRIPLAVQRRRKRKPDGTSRPITSASPELKAILKRIKKHILDKLMFGPGVHAYHKGRSQITAARPHAGCAFILMMDIRRFYPSIRPSQVRAMWQRVGCAPDVAGLLTRLTTCDYYLPQGFTTSNTLANVVRRALDQDMHDIAVRSGLVYTCFSDNLFLSGAHIPEDVLESCKAAARKYGWRIHKAEIRGPSDTKAMLGVVVADQLHKPAEYCADVADEIAAFQARPRKTLKAVRRIRGRIGHIRDINPEQAAPLQRQFDEAMRGVSLG